MVEDLYDMTVYSVGTASVALSNLCFCLKEVLVAQLYNYLASRVQETLLHQQPISVSALVIALLILKRVISSQCAFVPVYFRSA